MSYKRNFKKNKFKSIVTTIVLVALLVGVVAGIVALTNRNKTENGYTEINPRFAVGALGDKGEYVESDKSLYTKEDFDCEAGLKITLAFGADIKYQVFYYNELGNYVSASEELTAGTELDSPEGAVSARIVLTPIWDPDTDSDDRVIDWYDVFKYSNKITVKVIEFAEEETND